MSILSKAYAALAGPVFWPKHSVIPITNRTVEKQRIAVKHYGKKAYREGLKKRIRARLLREYGITYEKKKKPRMRVRLRLYRCRYTGGKFWIGGESIPAGMQRAFFRRAT